MSDFHVNKLVTIPLEEAKMSLKMSFITAADAAPQTIFEDAHYNAVFERFSPYFKTYHEGNETIKFNVEHKPKVHGRFVRFHGKKATVA